MLWWFKYQKGPRAKTWLKLRFQPFFIFAQKLRYNTFVNRNVEQRKSTDSIGDINHDSGAQCGWILCVKRIYFSISETMKNWPNDITRGKTNLIQVIEWRRHSDCHLFVRTIYHFHIFSFVLFQYVPSVSVSLFLPPFHSVVSDSRDSTISGFCTQYPWKYLIIMIWFFDSMWCRNSPDNILDSSAAIVRIIDELVLTVCV